MPSQLSLCVAAKGVVEILDANEKRLAAIARRFSFRNAEFVAIVKQHMFPPATK